MLVLPCNWSCVTSVRKTIFWLRIERDVIKSQPIQHRKTVYSLTSSTSVMSVSMAFWAPDSAESNTLKTTSVWPTVRPTITNARLVDQIISRELSLISVYHLKLLPLLSPIVLLMIITYKDAGLVLLSLDWLMTELNVLPLLLKSVLNWIIITNIVYSVRLDSVYSWITLPLLRLTLGNVSSPPITNLLCVKLKTTLVSLILLSTLPLMMKDSSMVCSVLIVRIKPSQLMVDSNALLILKLKNYTTIEWESQIFQNAAGILIIINLVWLPITL